MGAIMVSVMMIVISLGSLIYFKYQEKKEARKNVCEAAKAQGMPLFAVSLCFCGFFAAEAYSSQLYR